MSYSGFENEDKIIYALNGREFNELNTNLQQLIKDNKIRKNKNVCIK